ncbi:hypothetical protein [Streptomyces ipomoeae]|uniref:hypothetical protein n=1 Tax=Streptomyces ipomoeae TaxID=103232 RepID=UPI001146A62E|nr:hypothetical protein [Streptomyces ipomoeae]MDX2936984.1 hypothetical protein [Streptomyces ipomoeae]TQE20121.1 hypothetical protein SipoB123_29505 [Streptomyces ipomoeae]
MDDFTTADLRTAYLRTVDLTGIDLSGVHWSQYTTQWPSAMDVEDLKTRSAETPPGSGIRVAQSGTATIRGFAGR